MQHQKHARRVNEFGKGAYAWRLDSGIDKLVSEGLPVGITRSLLNDYLLVVIGELEDDELQALTELELIVFLYALLCDGRSGCSGERSKRVRLVLVHCLLL